MSKKHLVQEVLNQEHVEGENVEKGEECEYKSASPDQKHVERENRQKGEEYKYTQHLINGWLWCQCS